MMMMMTNQKTDDRIIINNENEMSKWIVWCDDDDNLIRLLTNETNKYEHEKNEITELWIRWDYFQKQKWQEWETNKQKMNEWLIDWFTE